MPATLTTPPPARTFGPADTWVAVSTDEVISPRGSVKLDFSGSGPAAAQTLRLQYAGQDLTLTVSATDGETALDLPVKGSETLPEYAVLVAERLAQNEALNAYFYPEFTGNAVTLVQRVHQPVDIQVTSTLSNTVVTVTDVTTVTQPDGLRALVQVYTDTGSLTTDKLLLSLHAPYDSAGIARLNIGPALAVLEPFLPPDSSLPAVAGSTTQPFGEATTAYTPYYLRYADKGGIPSVAQGLMRSASYTAIHGRLAADSFHAISGALRHAYTRRDGEAFIKPITDLTPDYLYWMPPTGVTQVYVGITVYWSDGTESAYNPYPTTGVTVVPGKMYWFAVGYRQAKVHLAPLQSGTAPDAYPVGYLAGIRRSDNVPLFGTHAVRYSVQRQGDWDGLHLIYANGVGGCEAVSLRGKVTTKSNIVSEEYNRDRNSSWTPRAGDVGQYGSRARTTWECNTGWLTDPYYLEHLRQLPLADCWLADLRQRRFRRVVVSGGDIVTNIDDDTLYSASFTVRAAWFDEAANL